MASNRLSRREFLHAGALSTAWALLTGCACLPQPTPEGTNTPEATATPAATRTPTPKTTPTATTVPEITLDIMAPVCEYEAAYREIWNVYEAQNEGVAIDLFCVNEDTAAAHEANIASGYLPAFENSQELQITANANNYELFYDLSEMEFAWWDRWTYDVKHAWSDLYELPGPRTLDIFQGFVKTWQYNQDLMEQAGLDPWRDVQTWDDLEKWLDEGTAWANATDGVEYFWNQAWHNGYFGLHVMNSLPMAWSDGQRADQVDCWLGRKKFNAEDSPYRHVYAFFLKAHERGWIPERFWTRQWEGDMEASYMAGTSVMMEHGPWVWDKAIAAGSTFTQAGFPLTPPADGGDWIQAAGPPTIDQQYFIRAGVEKLPEWPQIQHAWNWFHSPEVIAMRAQAEGRWPLYTLGEELDLQGPQYQAILKYIGKEEPFADIVWEESLTGQVLAGPHRKKGSKGVWDWESNGNNEVFRDLLTGLIDVQGALDVAQVNWNESYTGLPA